MDFQFLIGSQTTLRPIRLCFAVTVVLAEQDGEPTSDPLTIIPGGIHHKIQVGVPHEKRPLITHEIKHSGHACAIERGVVEMAVPAIGTHVNVFHVLLLKKHT